MTAHDKASAIAGKLRRIRLDIMVTAEDVLLKVSDKRELEFWYRKLVLGE